MSRVFCVLVALAVFWGSSPVNAEVVFSQTTPEEPISAFGSNDTPAGQKIADNFVIGGVDPVTVRSVRFLGGYNSRPTNSFPSVLPEDGFRVVIFSDRDGAPGALLPQADFDVGAAVLRTPTGGVDLNAVASPFEYFLDLGPGVQLQPSTDYWISITNNVEPEFGWLWARAIGVVDIFTSATTDSLETGPWTIGGPGGMFFELSTTNVPEPSFFTLGSLAVYALMLPRLNRS